jgi:hypothetical protein
MDCMPHQAVAIGQSKQAAASKLRVAHSSESWSLLVRVEYTRVHWAAARGEMAHMLGGSNSGMSTVHI